MNIRPSRTADIAGCAKISHVPELTSLQFASDAQAEAYLREFHDKGILIVAEDSGSIVGFINAEHMLNDFAWVDGITVAESRRGKGIGKKLFEKFRETLKDQGVKHLYLMAPQSNENTVNFYRKLGLEEGKRFIEFSKDL